MRSLLIFAIFLSLLAACGDNNTPPSGPDAAVDAAPEPQARLCVIDGDSYLTTRMGLPGVLLVPWAWPLPPCPGDAVIGVLPPTMIPTAANQLPMDGTIWVTAQECPYPPHVQCEVTPLDAQDLADSLRD